MLKQFKQWLRNRHYSHGTARDYAWAMSPGAPTPKRQNTRQKAKKLYDEFAERRHRDRNEGPVSEQRRQANDLAKKLLKERRRVTDADIATAISAWGFVKNYNRKKVGPAGGNWVLSDTFGLQRQRNGKWNIARITKQYPDFTRLLSQWARDRCPSDFHFQFPFTSFVVNKNLQASCHRDGNEGPSLVKAFGKFEGGHLRYFADDIDGQTRVVAQNERHYDLDVRAHPTLIDGNRSHLVCPFEGDRWSIVFYSRKGYDSAPTNLLSQLRQIFPTLPNAQSMWYYEHFFFRKSFMQWPRRGQ